MATVAQLKNLIPLESLTPSERSELSRSSREMNFAPNQVIFSRGENTKFVPFLLSGTVELVDTKGTRIVESSGPDGRHALSLGVQFQSTATCLKSASIIFINRDQLDLALTWSQTGAMEVSEVSVDDSEGDWMNAVLANPAFERVPPANIAQFFASLKSVKFGAGEIILREGDAGDRYFLIADGTVRVMRKDSAGKPVIVSELQNGAGFGEEALISGNPRNATVVAKTACSLMFLTAEDFEKLLKAPLLREADLENMSSSDEIIDVRTAQEFQRGHLPSARNFPLADIRETSKLLTRDRKYVVYCDTGRRSASATYLLRERGIDAALLVGGVEAADLCYLS